MACDSVKDFFSELRRDLTTKSGLCCCKPEQANAYARMAQSAMPDILAGDYLFDFARSKFLHVTLLLTNVCVTYSLWLVWSVYLPGLDATYAPLALFPSWFFISLGVAWICQFLSFGNQPRFSKLWVGLTYAGIPLILVASDIWLVSERSGDSDVIGNLEAMFTILTSANADTYANNGDYVFIFIKYLVIGVMYVASIYFAVKSIGGQPFTLVRLDEVKTSVNYLTAEDTVNERRERDRDPRRDFYEGAPWLNRLRQHFYPTSDFDTTSGACCGVVTAQHVVYPSKLWVAATLNVIFVFVAAWTFFSYYISTSRSVESAFSEIASANSAVTSYCNFAFESAVTSLDGYVGTVTALGTGAYFNKIASIISDFDEEAAKSEVCNDCSLASIEALIANITTEVGVLADISDVANNITVGDLVDFGVTSINATAIAAVLDVYTVLQNGYSNFTAGLGKVCSVRDTVAAFSNVSTLIYVAGTLSFFISLLIGFYASFVAFLAWRKKFLNYHFDANTFPYPQKKAEGLYPTTYYFKFIATFIGNGFALVLFTFFLVSAIFFFFSFIGLSEDDTTNPGNLIPKVPYLKIVIPIISIIIYQVLEKVISFFLETFIKSASVESLGFLSVWLELFYLPKGVLAGVYKIIMYLFYFFMGFLRPDCSIFQFGTEHWDASHVVFMGSIRYMHNQYYTVTLSSSEDNEENNACFDRWVDSGRKPEKDTETSLNMFFADEVAKNINPHYEPNANRMISRDDL